MKQKLSFLRFLLHLLIPHRWPKTGHGPTYFNRGFTLLELLISMTIVAILATMAVPSVLYRLVQAQVKEAPSLAEQLELGVVSAYQVSCPPPVGRGAGCTYPTGISVNGAGNTVATLSGAPGRGEYVSSITVIANGVVEATFSPKTVISGDVLDMIPAADGNGDLTWLCGYKAVPTGLTLSTTTNNTNVPPQYLPWGCK